MIKIWAPILIILCAVGAYIAYLSRPELDTLILWCMPLAGLAAVLALPGLIYYGIKRQCHHLPKFFVRSLAAALAFGSPILGWMSADAVLSRGTQWKGFAYSQIDRGREHKLLGIFNTKVDCQAAGRAALDLPTRLGVKGCQGDSCLADSYLCGLDCGAESGVSPISEFICTDKVHETLAPQD